MPKSNNTERYMRTERLIKARQADPEIGQIEEMCFAHEILEITDFEHEAELVTTAYLNYRYMTPFERTQEFARQYQKWYANKQLNARGRVGRRVHRKHLAMWPDRLITCLWRARQRADALGAPYDRYIMAGMDLFNDRGTNELPAPNQLSEPGVVADIERVLDRLRKADRIELLPRECSPRFHAENYAGDPVQVAALDAIEAEVRNTGKVNQPGLLRRYMRERRLISEPEARRRFGDELVDEALSERLLNPERPHQPIEGPGMAAPGCFGCHQQSRVECGTCPFATPCVERAARVDAVLLERHGTTDVRVNQIREGNRIRQQRKRDRKRAGMTMTLQEEKRALRELGDPKLKEKRLKAKERRDDRKRKEQAASKPIPLGAKPEPESGPELQPQG